MTTAADTNVFAALLEGTVEEAPAARRSLGVARKRGAIVIRAPVYAELISSPGRGEEAVDEFLGRARVEVDWELDEETWRVVARVFRGYAERRRARPGGAGPRRILADFLIGAHATLLRFDTAHSGPGDLSSGVPGIKSSDGGA